MPGAFRRRIYPFYRNRIFYSKEQQSQGEGARMSVRVKENMQVQIPEELLGAGNGKAK
jgi:Na+-transporting NADH:ubiquinone oxidoreductase subunit NqrF